MGRGVRHLERYRDLVGDFEAFSEAMSRAAPLHLRVNTLKTTVERLRDRLDAQGVATTPEPWCPFLLRIDALPRKLKLGATLSHALGHYYLQSASSAVAAVALGVRPGDKVLDLCAAPGSKTTLLAQVLAGTGALVANEPSQGRITALEENLKRLGIANVAVTSCPGEAFPPHRRFDRILVDAPCSGEGTWRGPEARARPGGESARERLVKRQALILDRAARLLAPGGELVYSTCTFAPEENELVAAQAVIDHGLTPLPLGMDLPAAPGLTAWEGKTLPPGLALAARLYPHRFDSEGFFVIRLAKPA